MTDYVSFGAGFYAGYLLSFIADKVINFALGFVTGGSTALLSLVGFVVAAIQIAKTGGFGRVAKVGVIATSKLASATSKALDAVTYAGEVISANDIVDEEATAGVLAGLREVGTVENIQVVERFQIALNEGKETTSLTDRLFDGVSAKGLSLFLARTGDRGPETFADAVGNSFDAGRFLLVPSIGSLETNARFQRVFTTGTARGELVGAQTGTALSIISDDDRTPVERFLLTETVTEAGPEGVRFLSAAGETTATNLAAKFISVQQPPARTGRTHPTEGGEVESEFHSLLRQAGGADTATTVKELGTESFTDMLRVEGGADDVARANLVDALAAGDVTVAEAQAFINEVEDADRNTRQQRLNDLAFSEDTAAAAAVITGEEEPDPGSDGSGGSTGGSSEPLSQ